MTDILRRRCKAEILSGAVESVEIYMIHQRAFRGVNDKSVKRNTLQLARPAPSRVETAILTRWVPPILRDALEVLFVHDGKEARILATVQRN
jgi:hypothetical protein